VEFWKSPGRGRGIRQAKLEPTSIFFFFLFIMMLHTPHSIADWLRENPIDKAGAVERQFIFGGLTLTCSADLRRAVSEKK
jgi:hypothetical protein